VTVIGSEALFVRKSTLNSRSCNAGKAVKSPAGHLGGWERLHVAQEVTDIFYPRVDVSVPMVAGDIVISRIPDLPLKFWSRLMFPRMMEHGDLEHSETTIYVRGDHPQAARGGRDDWPRQFEIALACDVIIATRRSRFGLPEPLVGAVALGGGLHRLARQVGLKQAMGMILTGDMLGIVAHAQAGTASQASVSSINTAFADFDNTIVWNGVTAVTRNGLPVGYSLTSVSGIDWSGAAVVPVPAAA
jgi:hypothetical protein